MTDEAREARIAYYRKRRNEARENMTDEAKESHNEYYRNWRKKNKDKVREYNERYWQKKAALKNKSQDGEDAENLYFINEIMDNIKSLEAYLPNAKLQDRGRLQLKREISVLEDEIDILKRWT